MNSLTSSSWHPNQGSLWGQIDDTLNRWADAVKDALLDWDLDDEDWRQLPPAMDLPWLNKEEYLAALRGRTEQALRTVADTINALPPGADRRHGQQTVAEIMADLTREAFAVGLHMRVNAALHRGTPATGSRAVGGALLDA